MHLSTAEKGVISPLHSVAGRFVHSPAYPIQSLSTELLVACHILDWSNYRKPVLPLVHFSTVLTFFTRTGHSNFKTDIPPRFLFVITGGLLQKLYISKS